MQRLTRAYLAAFLALLTLAALLGGASALTTAMAATAVVGTQDSFYVVFLGTLFFWRCTGADHRRSRLCVALA